MTATNFTKLALATLFTLATSSTGLLTNPIRTRISRDIKTPDPVPQSGIDEAVSLMSTGRMYRYNVPNAQESVVSKCEVEIAEYTGHKYCVALNSCGSAIMLMMKCAGLQPGDEVLSNAFTFGAVPSAIEHAGGKAVYVESDYNHVMDIDDLEKKLVEYPNTKFCLISHMRGKVADMDAVKAACDRHNVILLEDCAHSLGVSWKDKHTGHIGKACAISSQSYKMINSGEGGFLLTDDPEIAAKCAVYAGAYEGLAGKHLTVPGPEVFADLPTQIPNYSLRMSGIAAAVIRPQILTLDERREKYNKRYAFVTQKLVERKGHLLSIPTNTPGMTPVHDSLQFNLSHKITDEQVQKFLDECSEHGLPVELFGHKTNARNFVNWGFAPAEDPLPLTAKMLTRACDVRLPLMWDDEDFETMVDVICESLDAAIES
uniref:Aminotransferase class I/classII domain-containing protein n=1 Tax=Rhizochromulina marina TaxID=1034831 RepID=A0A7S2SV05_9STRA|mmetsp:Transcript_19806/g.39109  ORF Transcript_19806/g.39109 Transcript_19806/m.39109 type:complete len:430 (+) Transcript_19806:192-1481(+)|eukprot:CAMPEP_0171330200 /NCGR_PEP_ID=MMETSP0878-20121228/1830_1 /TAXON_ID=67004 /ORGANISM="Thalassiosira weissflogii, Strain CCMP1336" /LENGTH=429 /DNA_ID=CAMNT_0011830427 /DNA_START=268 /DNA_END=1557 /DNA_ORIENTATION=-